MIDTFSWCKDYADGMFKRPEMYGSPLEVEAQLHVLHSLIKDITEKNSREFYRVWAKQNGLLSSVGITYNLSQLKSMSDKVIYSTLEKFHRDFLASL